MTYIQIEEHIKQDLIDKVKAASNNTQGTRDRFINFIERNPVSFYGRSKPEHITSSVLVIDSESKEVLLTHHKKFNKWLQLGGHWMDDGNQEHIFDAGVREVFEEAYGNNPVPYTALKDKNPIDLDIHDAGDDLHYDICFLIDVDKKIPYTISKESKSLEWVKIDNIIADMENKKYEHRLIRLCYFALAEINKMENDKKQNPTDNKRLKP